MDGILTTGGIAALISAATGLLTWQLSKRAQASAERRQDAIDKAPYIEQLQAWSWRTIQEAQRQRDEAITHERAECAERIAQLRNDFTHRMRELEVQHGARVLTAERREEYWRQIAQGQTGEGEAPPPRRDQ